MKEFNATLWEFVKAYLPLVALIAITWFCVHILSPITGLFTLLTWYVFVSLLGFMVEKTRYFHPKHC